MSKSMSIPVEGGRLLFVPEEKPAQTIKEPSAFSGSWLKRILSPKSEPKRALFPTPFKQGTAKKQDEPVLTLEDVKKDPIAALVNAGVDLDKFSEDFATKFVSEDDSWRKPSLPVVKDNTEVDENYQSLFNEISKLKKDLSEAKNFQSSILQERSQNTAVSEIEAWLKSNKAHFKGLSANPDAPAHLLALSQKAAEEGEVDMVKLATQLEKAQNKRFEDLAKVYGFAPSKDRSVAGASRETIDEAIRDARLKHTGQSDEIVDDGVKTKGLFEPAQGTGSDGANVMDIMSKLATQANQAPVNRTVDSEEHGPVSHLEKKARLIEAYS